MTAEIRRTRPDDRPAVRSMLTRCSQRTLQARFLSPLPVPTSPAEEGALVLADLLVEERTDGDATYVAVEASDVVGVAELRDGGHGSAEIALLVEDAHHGRGIGTALVRRVAADAREAGIAVLTAYLSAENRRMLRTFRSAGLLPVATSSAGVSEVTILIGRDMPAPIDE